MTKPVLIIYTGGTIGMVNDPETGALCPFNFDQIACEGPGNQRIWIHDRQLHFTGNYRFFGLQPQLWKDLCSIILKNYDDYRDLLSCMERIPWPTRPQP
ncbi:MAG: asparaginase domain-containing protein [Butyricimonas faecihominis]